MSNIYGDDNTAIGHNALYGNTVGADNTAIGADALRNSTGSGNIGIGADAGRGLVSDDRNIYLGSFGSAFPESNTMRLGDTAQQKTFIAGIAHTGVSGAIVQVDDFGQLGVVLSSARYKQDIAPMESRSEGLLQLRPVTFAYKDDARGLTHYGLIAEEVATVYPELVTRTATGEAQTVRYQELIPMLLNELQREHQEVAGLRKELAELRALVAGQMAGQRTIAAGPLLTQSETDEATR